ncbi:calvin cycle protein CP12-1, chloroplastic-like [Wolffia australiana]
MASALAGVSASTARPARPAAAARRAAAAPAVVRMPAAGARRSWRAASSGPPTPAELAEKVQESIENAKETCAGDPVSGECVAAWDEVEELSAAASHARDKAKTADPLDAFCKDNPEADECRTYED